MTKTLRKQFNLPGIITPNTQQFFYQTQALHMEIHFRKLNCQLFCSELLHLLYNENITIIPMHAKFDGRDIIFILDNTLSTSSLKNTPFNNINNYLPTKSISEIIHWITSIFKQHKISYQNYGEYYFSSNLDSHSVDLLCQEAYQENYPIVKKMMLENMLPNETASSPRPKI